MCALLRDVGHVDHGVIEPMAIEHLAARAPHEGRWRLRRQLLAGLPHRIFPRDPVLCITPSLKIGLGSFRQKHLPRGLEIGAGLLEGRGGVGLMFARKRTRITVPEPAASLNQRSRWSQLRRGPDGDSVAFREFDS